MAAKKIGTLIREARTGAGLTQEQLARKISGVSASDISKAERGEKDLSQEQLKAIAKATGVTQKSLLEAAKGGSTAKKTSGSTAKKPASSTAKKTASTSSVKVTAAEKKLLELYRAADSEAKKNAVKVLKGESLETEGLLGTLLGGALDVLGMKREMPGEEEE